MIKLLSRLFIKDRENYKDPSVRSAYGMLCGIWGIFLNLLLFAGKYFAGIVSGSVAIVADAFNSLSDAGSSIISILGFWLAGKKPDRNHPFGHGRLEYLTGLVISVIIISVGLQLCKGSVIKIIRPEAVEFALLPALILLVSIVIKLYIWAYNRSIGKKISSSAMQASAADAVSDSVSTAVVLLSMIISAVFHINIDAYAGLLVSLFIIYSGISAVKDTLSPLLGQAPDPELVVGIQEVVLSHPEIIGLHDMAIHDYGPGRIMASLHAEVNGKGDIYEIHNIIDRAENEVFEKYGCITTIHMDPVDVDNIQLSRLRRDVAEKLKQLDCAVTIHDFRMVPGPEQTSLVFDAVFPRECRDSDQELIREIQALVKTYWPKYKAVVKIDRTYVL